MTRHSKSVLAVFLTLALSAAGRPSSAQDSTPPSDTGSRPKIGCLMGAPQPRCASFWIVEMQASATLFAPERVIGPPGNRYRIESRETLFEWNVGHMANLAEDWAVGGSVTLGSGAHEIFTGVRGRLRRWVGPQVSVEAEAGLARGNGSGSWYPDQTGVSGGLRFNVQDYGSVFVRYDGFGEPPPLPGASDGEQSFDGSQHFLRGGVALGGKAALIGTGVVAVGYAVLLGLFLASGGWR